MSDLARELALSWANDEGLHELAKALYGPEVTVADVADDLLGEDNPVSKLHDGFAKYYSEERAATPGELAAERAKHPIKRRLPGGKKKFSYGTTMADDDGNKVTDVGEKPGTGGLPTKVVPHFSRDTLNHAEDAPGVPRKRVEKRFAAQDHPRDSSGKFRTRHDALAASAELAVAGALFALTAHYGGGVKAGIVGLRGASSKVKAATEGHEYMTGNAANYHAAQKALGIDKTQLIAHLDQMKAAGLAYTEEQQKALLTAPRNAKAFKDLAEEQAKVFEGAAEAQKKNIDTHLAERYKYIQKILGNAVGAVASGAGSSYMVDRARANLQKNLISKGYSPEEADLGAEKLLELVDKLLPKKIAGMAPKKLLYGGLALGGIAGLGEAATGYHAWKNEAQGTPSPYRPALGAAALAHSGTGAAQAGWEARRAGKEFAMGNRGQAATLGVAAATEAIGSTGLGAYGANQVYRAHKQGRSFTGDASQQTSEAVHSMKNAYTAVTRGPVGSHAQVARDHAAERAATPGPISNMEARKNSFSAAKNVVEKPLKKEKVKKLYQEYLIWKAYTESKHKRDSSGKFSYMQMLGAQMDVKDPKARRAAYKEANRKTKADPKYKKLSRQSAAGSAVSIGGAGVAAGGYIKGTLMHADAHKLAARSAHEYNRAKETAHEAFEEKNADLNRGGHRALSATDEHAPQVMEEGATGKPAYEEKMREAMGGRDEAMRLGARARNTMRAGQALRVGGPAVGIPLYVGGLAYSVHTGNKRNQIMYRNQIEAAKKRTSVAKKLLTEDEKDKRDRGLIAGASAIGLAAGGVGFGAGVRDVSRGMPAAKEGLTGLSRARDAMHRVATGYKKSDRLSRALLTVEPVGLAGELGATHKLGNDALKPKKKTTSPGAVVKSEISKMLIPHAFGSAEWMEAYDKLAQAANKIYPKMESGEITKDNITPEHLKSLRDVMHNNVLIRNDADFQRIDPVKDLKPEPLVEGSDWGLATHPDGTLGAYMLDDLPAGSEKMTFHHWDENHVRRDTLGRFSFKGDGEISKINLKPVPVEHLADHLIVHHKIPADEARGYTTELQTKIHDMYHKTNMDNSVHQHVDLKVVKSVDVTWTGEIAKVDVDKRQVFGWASIATLNGEQVVDRQGDMIEPDEVEKAAYNYVLTSRVGGDMHRRIRKDDAPHHASDLIESMVFTPEKIAKMGLPSDFPVGWWVGFKVNDEDTWQEVKKGNRKGFSIHGRGKRIVKSDVSKGEIREELGEKAKHPMGTAMVVGGAVNSTVITGTAKLLRHPIGGPARNLAIGAGVLGGAALAHHATEKNIKAGGVQTKGRTLMAGLGSSTPPRPPIVEHNMQQRRRPQ